MKESAPVDDLETNDVHRHKCEQRNDPVYVSKRGKLNSGRCSDNLGPELVRVMFLDSANAEKMGEALGILNGAMDKKKLIVGKDGLINLEGLLVIIRPDESSGIRGIVVIRD